MHFFDAWRELAPAELVRLLGPVVFLVLAAFIPGPRIARLASAAVAVAIPFLRELAAPPLLVAGWTVLWLLLVRVRWKVEETSPPPTTTTGMAFESGTVALLLGAALLALLVAAVARQDLGPEESRRVSLGVVLVGLGLLHLMLRRFARRAAIGFAAMGLGLQLLDSAARDAQVQVTLPEPGGVLLATALTVALVLRIASGRERFAGTPWVSDAHDLHD